MTDESPVRRREAGAVPFRDLLDQISARLESYRTETRDARHAQANATQQAIGELEARLGSRITTLEMTIASSNPTSLGPRINAIEMWQAKSELREANLAETMGRIAASLAERDRKVDAHFEVQDTRLDGLTAIQEQQKGANRAFGALATGLGVVATVIAIIGNLPS